MRELRQHASRYLERVRCGESIEVTDRGRPVAVLVPVADDPWARLVASGAVSPAEGDLLDEEPSDYGVRASEELARLRDGER